MCQTATVHLIVPTGDSNTTEIASLKAGMAQSVAISALPNPEYGKSNFAIALGNYAGNNTIAIGFSKHNASSNTTFRLLGSQSNGIRSTAASFGWNF